MGGEENMSDGFRTVRGETRWAILHVLSLKGGELLPRAVGSLPIAHKEVAMKRRIRTMRADTWSRRKDWRRWLKKMKVRRERRIAKRWPDCPPGYGRYRGWWL